MKAFVLGAGLGTRLRPLTEWLPKPLIPFHHRPLIAHAFDHLLRSGVSGFIVNTHHCAQAYAYAFPKGEYRGAPVTFRHEPVLLETAGGIANVADLLGNERFLVYNGDVLTDAPLAPLLEEHERAANEVTLLARTEGPNRNLGIRAGRVEDLRRELGRAVDQDCQFSGVYVVEPAFLRRLTPGRKESVVPIFQRMILEGARLGACVIDKGTWWDLGDAETYRIAQITSSSPALRVHPTARLGEGARIDHASWIGPEAEIGARAEITASILWPGAKVSAGSIIRDAVIRGDLAIHCRWFF